MSVNRRKNVGINAILNVINQSLSLLFPIITYPYVLRVLGVINIGKVNYASSIISYFSMFAMLGIKNYAIREGAKRKDNKIDFQTFVSEIFTINLLSTTFAYLLLIIAVILVPKFEAYSKMLLLQSLSIILTTLGVDWINNIYEDFFLITVRSIVTHIVSLILLFIFVKEPADIYKYASLTVVTNGIICITNLVYCQKYVKIKPTFRPNLKKHIRPLLILFANTIAISIYVSLDITMLGWMRGDYDVGLYSISVKIYTIIKNMMAAIYIVTVPRLSYYRGKENIKGYKQLNTDLWSYLTLILIPAAAGLIAISNEIIMFMGGLEYIEAVTSLRILGMALIFAIFGGLVTACLNITLGREKDNLIATIISALINFVLNLLFIPLFSQNGAAFTTLLSEAFVLAFCFIRIPGKNRYLEFDTVLREIAHSLLGVISIVVATILFRGIDHNYVLRMVLIIVFTVTVYPALLFVIKDKYFMDIVGLAKTKIRGIRR